MSILQKLEKLPGWKSSRQLHSPGANLEDESSKKLSVWVYGDSTLPVHAKLQMISAQIEKLSENSLWLEDAYLLVESKYKEHLGALVKSDKFKGLPSDLCNLVGVDSGQMCSLFTAFVSEEEAFGEDKKALIDKLEVATNFSFFVPTLILCETQKILLDLDRALIPHAQENLWISALSAPLLYQIRIVEALASLISKNTVVVPGAKDGQFA